MLRQDDVEVRWCNGEAVLNWAELSSSWILFLICYIIKQFIERIQAKLKLNSQSKTKNWWWFIIIIVILVKLLY